MIFWIKITISLLLPLSLFAQNTPQETTRGEDYAFNSRFFYQRDKTTWLVETHYRNQDFGDDQKDFTIGVRYRFHSNWKFGLFAAKRYGIRYDDDWVKDGTVWRWKDKSSIAEDIFYPELTYRTLISDLVLELRAKHLFQLDNGNKTLTTRASLTKFFFYDSSPFLNLSLRYEWFFPLNYSEADINEQWAYLDLLYHFNSMIKFGPFIAKGEQVWTNYQSFTQMTGKTYGFSDKSFIYGFNFLIYL